MVRRVDEPAEQDTKEPQSFRVVTGRDVRRVGEGYTECFVHWSGGQTVLVKSRTQRRGLRSG